MKKNVNISPVTTTRRKRRTKKKVTMKKTQELKNENQSTSARVDIKTTNIKTKLKELNCPIEDLVLGDFDAIGEYTAKKNRARDNKLYKTTGCFFRPNYERGILIAAMIKRYRPTRILEVGFGRGYWSTCAAKAMFELGIDGKVTSIDVNIDDKHLKMMSSVFPGDWLSKLELHRARSVEKIAELEGDWDIVYIDADHSYGGVKADWDAVKDRFKQFVIFDDYHLPEAENDANIDVARFVNEIVGHDDRELVLMDRLIFNDDRNQEERHYGQVIIRNPEFKEPEDPYAYSW